MGEEKSPRIEWIDQCRGVLFLMVIFVHSGICPEFLRYIIDPIFLPGFFALSGFLYREKNFTVHLKSAFNSLFFPFFLYSLIISLMLFVKSGLDTNVFLKTFVELFIMGGDQLWFIPCLLCVEIIFYSVKFCIPNKKFEILLGLFSVASFFLVTAFKGHLYWNIDTALWCLLYYIWGVWIKRNFFKESPSKKNVCFVFFIYLVLAVLFGLYGLGGGMVDMHNNFVNNRLVYLFLSLYGCYALFLFISILPPLKYFSLLGQITLFAFPFHSYVYHLFVKIFAVLELSSCLFLITSIFTGLFFVCCQVLFGKKCPLLFGRKKILR